MIGKGRESMQSRIHLIAAASSVGLAILFIAYGLIFGVPFGPDRVLVVAALFIGGLVYGVAQSDRLKRKVLRQENSGAVDASQVKPDFQEISFKSWIAWVFACAFSAVAAQVVATALMRQSRPSDPSFMWLLLFAVIAGAFILPRIVEGVALRLCIPRLSFIQWTFAILLAYILTLAAVVVVAMGRSRSEFFGSIPETLFSPDHRMRIDWLRAQIQTPDTMSVVLDLPWRSWLTGQVVNTVLVALCPALVLARRSKVGLWRFLLAACIGSLCASLADIFVLETNYKPNALNGLTWQLRFEILMPIMARAAVWGMASGLAMILLTRRVNRAYIAATGSSV